jgi:hypothetical protein
MAKFITDAITCLQQHSASLLPLPLSLSLRYLALSPQPSFKYLTLSSPKFMIIQ